MANPIASKKILGLVILSLVRKAPATLTDACLPKRGGSGTQTKTPGKGWRAPTFRRVNSRVPGEFQERNRRTVNFEIPTPPAE